MPLSGQPATDAADTGRDGRSGTLARGLAILDVLMKAPQPLGLAEIAAAAGLDQSTTLRLLRTLEEQEFVVRHDGAKRYWPSPKALSPLPLMHPLEQLRREGAPIIQALSNRLRVTTLLTLFVGYERMVLDIAQHPGSLTPYYGTWLRGPLHANAGGKALLMTLDPERRRALLGPEPFAAPTAKTITSWAALEAELALSADRGFVVTRDEQLEGVTSVAANITTWTGVTAGCVIVTATTKNSPDEWVADVGEELKRTASLILYQAPALEAVSHFCAR